MKIKSDGCHLSSLWKRMAWSSKQQDVKNSESNILEQRIWEGSLNKRKKKSQKIKNYNS